MQKYLNLYDSLCFKLLPTILLSIMVTACGGGEASSGSNIGGQSQIPISSVQSLQIDCQGTYCGATASGYVNASGSDVAVYSYDNISNLDQSLQIAIPMLSSGQAYGVLTNYDSNSKTINTAKLSIQSAQTINDNPEALQLKILEKNNNLLNNLKDTKYSIEQEFTNNKINIAPAIALGTVKSFNILRNVSTSGSIATVDDSANFTLKRVDNLIDGVIINYWVETSEYGVGKITDTLLSSIQNTFSNGGADTSVYAIIKGLSGNFYGNNSFSNLIPYDGTLNILVSNITPDATAYGMMGYFDGQNLFKTTSIATSNQAAIVVIDSETLYANGETKATTDSVVSALSHEFTHMVNFYQRGIVRYSNGSKAFSAAMEETSAMMMEDILSSHIGATAKTRYQQWVGSKELNCNMDTFNYSFAGSGCLDYPYHSAFGSFLLRKYGLNGYKYLNNDVSQTAMVPLIDNMIKNNGGDSFADELKKWHVSFVLSKFSKKPLEFGYPQQTIINGVNTFTFSKLDDLVYTGTTVSATKPNTLVGYGGYVSSYGLFLSGSTLTKTIVIPARSTISVVITP